MRDTLTHGIKQDSPPMTYCGITPFGHKTTRTSDMITCVRCRQAIPTWTPLQIQPRKEAYEEVQPKRRGRPKKAVGDSPTKSTARRSRKPHSHEGVEQPDPA